MRRVLTVLLAGMLVLAVSCGSGSVVGGAAGTVAPQGDAAGGISVPPVTTLPATTVVASTSSSTVPSTEDLGLDLGDYCSIAAFRHSSRVSFFEGADSATVEDTRLFFTEDLDLLDAEIEVAPPNVVDALELVRVQLAEANVILADHDWDLAESLPLLEEHAREDRFAGVWSSVMAHAAFNCGLSD